MYGTSAEPIAPCSPPLCLLPWRRRSLRAAGMLGAAPGLRHSVEDSAYLQMQIRSPGSRGGTPECSPASLVGEAPASAPCRGSLASSVPVGVFTMQRARGDESRAVRDGDPAAPSSAQLPRYPLQASATPALATCWHPQAWGMGAGCRDQRQRMRHSPRPRLDPRRWEAPVGICPGRLASLAAPSSQRRAL